MDNQQKLEIVYVDINDIHPNEYNPKGMSEKEHADLYNSIKTFGFAEPLVLNNAPGRENILIGGHQRLPIAKELGYKEVPVVYRTISDLALEQELCLRLTTNTGHIDWDLLANFDEGILTLSGFDDEDIDKIFKGNSKEDDFDTKKELEKIGEPLSKKGEIYQLGNHRLICGSCTDPKALQALFEDKKAKLCFTYPPYNMGSNLYTTYKDNLKSEEYIQLNMDAFNTMKNHLKGFVFWNLSYNKNARFEFMEIMYKLIKESGLEFMEMIVWDKGHGMPITSREMLTRAYEDILVMGDPDLVARDYELLYMGRTEKKMYLNKKNNKGITNYWRIDTNDSQDINLQACFPVALPRRAIELTTERGDIILDIFMGSGTTIIAAEQLNRKAYGVELDPKYCDLIRKRWVKLTNGGNDEGWADKTHVVGKIE